MRVPRKSLKRVSEPHGHPPALVKPATDEPVPTRENPIHRRCKNCGKMFWAVRPDHWFHSPACRKQFHKNNNTGYGKVREIFKKEMRAFTKEFEKLKQVVDKLAERVDALEGFPPHD